MNMFRNKISSRGEDAKEDTTKATTAQPPESSSSADDDTPSLATSKLPAPPPSSGTSPSPSRKTKKKLIPKIIPMISNTHKSSNNNNDDNDNDQNSSNNNRLGFTNPFRKASRSSSTSSIQEDEKNKEQGEENDDKEERKDNNNNNKNNDNQVNNETKEKGMRKGKNSERHQQQQQNSDTLEESKQKQEKRNVDDSSSEQQQQQKDETAVDQNDKDNSDNHDHHHDVGDDDNNNDEQEDLALELENLDIDADFNIWESFRQSRRSIISALQCSPSGSATADTDSPTATTTTTPTNQEALDMEKWATRMERDEIYSHYYKPSSKEKAELDELAQMLGIAKANPGVDWMMGEHYKNVSKLLYEDPRSILLKRGPIALKGGEERELILLTHGFLLATVGGTSKGLLGGLGFVSRTYEKCEFLSNIEVVSDDGILEAEASNGHYETNLDFTVRVRGHDEWHRYRFSCTTTAHKKAWLDALERAVLQGRLHDRKAQDEEKIAAWQHELFQTSIHTLAIMGDPSLMETLLQAHPELSCEVEEYDSYTPLHIACIHQKLDCMSTLLQYGAKVDQLDGHGHPPMYYAVLNNFDVGIELLLHFGAKRVDLVNDEARGELFGAVEEAQEAVRAKAERKRVIEEAKAERRKQISEEKATAANAALNAQAAGISSTMAENMSAMRERGERLERLDDKSEALQNEAADFRDMAKQMKEKLKRKNNNWFGI